MGKGGNMKIYISTDLEGATGVFKWEQVDPGNPGFKDAMKLLMGDVAAVAEGLKQSGVREIYVQDGHDGGDNFIPECMVSGVKYITGRNKGITLDDTFDGYIMVGRHSMNGTPGGLLHHTQDYVSEARYWYDGVERGEIYQGGVIAGNFNVPVILVTGDEATCEEARATFGDNLPTVAVKKGIGREAAVLLSPTDTRQLLIEGARKSIEMLPELKPYRVKLPLKIRIRSLATEAKTPDNPYFTDMEGEVRYIKDIYTGSKP